MWKEQDRHRRNQHRVVDLRLPETADDELLQRRSETRWRRRSTRLSERERRTLLAHEVAGQDTQSLAAELGSTAGAVAAQLNRTRARLRVEYLLALETSSRPPTRVVPCCWRCPAATAGGSERWTPAGICWSATCAPAQRAAARRGPAARRRGADRRSQATPSRRWRGRRRGSWRPRGLHRGRPHVIATAVSEIARNIVRFAGYGEVSSRCSSDPARDPGRGAGHRSGHRGRRAGAGRRLQHLPRAGPGLTRRPPTDGRVRDRVRGGPGHHSDDDQVATGEDDR